MLDLPEIACKLDQLWFHIDYYLSYSEELHRDSLKNPSKYIYDWIPETYHQYIKKDEQGYYRDAGTAICRMWEMKFDRKIIESKTIVSHYNANIIDVIKENQRDWVLFLIGLDRYTLHNEKPYDNLPGGHVILASKIEDNQVVIFDPGPPLLLYHKVPLDRFMVSMDELGKYYSFMKITDKNAAYSSYTVN